MNFNMCFLSYKIINLFSCFLLTLQNHCLHLEMLLMGVSYAGKGSIRIIGFKYIFLVLSVSVSEFYDFYVIFNIYLNA
jgi:hypothetical protein